MTLRYGSLFSGVEAATLAWEPLGWTAAFVAEVDPFCCEVLKQRWPSVPNLGDVTAADFAERARALGPIDVLVGGSPCQSFSNAGKRRGFDDDRGNLTKVFWRLAAEIKPQWVLWENVPGVLSQDGGRAFGAILGEVAEQWQRWAYRILDSRHFGVAQRRRRVFIVASAGAGCPAKVLLEPQSQGRDPAAGGEAGAGTAAAAEAGTGAVTGGFYAQGGTHSVSFEAESVPALKIGDGNAGHHVGVVHPATAFGGGNCSGSIDVATTTTTTTRTGLRLDFDTDTFVVQPVVCPIDMRQASRGDKFTNNRKDGSSGGAPGTGIGEFGDPSPTLAESHTPAVVCVTGQQTHALTCEGADASEDGTGRGTPIAAYAEDTCSSLLGGGDRGYRVGAEEAAGGQLVVETAPAFAIQERGRAGGRKLEVQEDLDYALTAPAGGGRGQERNVVTPQLVVRRLTPTECETLQAMPKGHTAATYKKKPASDSVRYKAVGNSMTVTVIRAIGERIGAETEATRGGG